MRAIEEASTLQWHHKPGIAGLMLAALWLAACGATPAVMTANDTSTSAKISPVLMQAVQQLKGGGSLAANGPVRGDAQGRIQIYVYVSSMTAEVTAALGTQGLQNQVVSPALHVVQGWVLPQDLQAIAALPFVTRITPPHYAQPH